MADVIQMDQNTWRFENDFVRFFLLQGTERAVLIDSGYNCENAREMAEKLTKLPVFLLNTHGDGDHASGTAAFDEIRIREEDYENCNLAQRFPNTKCVNIQDGETISLGNRTLEMITIPGHTYGSVAILDVENRTLYAGDSVQDGHIFMFGKHRSASDFAGSMKKLIQMKDRYDTIVASHGKVTLASDYAEKVLESWMEVQEGKIEYTNTDLHGMTVKSYDGKYCGFFCE